MSYTVEYHPLVVKQDIPKLGTAAKERIKAVIEDKLMTQPEVFGIPLRHSREGHRKLRVGDYRIVFFIEKMIVKILVIEHRSVVYKTFAKRAQR